MSDLYRELLQVLRQELKKQLPEIEENGDWLWAHPETGFREVETQRYVDFVHFSSISTIRS